MTRFAWTVDEAVGFAHVPVGGTRRHAGVLHMTVQLPVACAAGATAVVTVPPDFPRHFGGGRSTGVALAHGDDAAPSGRLLTELAAALALHGFVVVRPALPEVGPSNAGEHRRAAILEAALDTAASSPFARGVRQWVLAGLDSGARVALAVGMRCRETVGGFALLSYPLTGLPAAVGGLPPPPSPPPPPPGDGPLPPPAAPPLNHGALAAAGAPTLFVSSASDPRAPAAALIDLASRLPPATTRVVLAAAVDAAFSDPSTRRLEADAFLQLATALIDFAAAVDAGAPHGCQLPGPSTVTVPAAMARKTEAAPPPGVGAAAAAAAPGAGGGEEAMEGAPGGVREHSMPLALG